MTLPRARSRALRAIDCLRSCITTEKDAEARRSAFQTVACAMGDYEHAMYALGGVDRDRVEEQKGLFEGKKSRKGKSEEGNPTS